MKSYFGKEGFFWHLFNKLFKRTCPICEKRSRLRRIDGENICFDCFVGKQNRQTRRWMERKTEKHEKKQTIQGLSYGR